jgi:tetratricopeptide (TPR) repeat protein
MRKLACFLLMIGALRASPEVVERAQALYQKTEYSASLHLLEQDPIPDAATYELTGKNYYMLDKYEKSVQFLEKARALEPSISDYYLWLGRAYGRRAETEGWLLAGSRASKARQSFETAIALDPRNNEAMNDLFDYYLNAPGFLGGGVDKAQAIARRIERDRPAEYHHEMSLLADHKKQYLEAVAHLRKAVDLAPDDVGRALDLARYLAKLGRIEDSEALFAQAAERWPDDPGIAFARGKFYVDSHREPERARQLLERYLKADVTPDDPPKQAAEKLLRQLASR